MSKRSGIRWRDADNAELRRIVKNYNAKLSRTRKKLEAGGEILEASRLPHKASVKELREAIGTRREFNQIRKNMQNFIDYGYTFQANFQTHRHLENVVAKFNAKVDRIAGKRKGKGMNRQSAYAPLPEKLTIRDVIKNASNLEALREDIEIYEGFLKRGAETLIDLPGTKHNIQITKWQKDTSERLINEVINPNRQKRLEEYKQAQVKYGGREAGYKHGDVRMDKDDFEEFAPMNLFTYSTDYTGLKKKFKLIMAESQSDYWEARTNLAKANYLDAIMRNLPSCRFRDLLVEHVSKVSIDSFYRVLKSEVDLFIQLYKYKEHPEQWDIIQQEIWNEWLPDVDMYESLIAGKILYPKEDEF